MSFSLQVFGGALLEGEDGPLTGGAVQRHRLALLSILAVSAPRPVSRDRILGLLWPDKDTEGARQLLNQAVHALRRALAQDAVLSVGEELQLNTAVIRADVIGFEEATKSGELERAAALYTGPLLDGFFLAEAPDFERWVDRERERLASAAGRNLESLAESAEQSGKAAEAVDRWKARAAQDPLDSRIAIRVMQALERAGNRAGALQYALGHQKALRDELDIEPDQALSAYVERLRRATGSGLEVPPIPTLRASHQSTNSHEVTSAPVIRRPSPVALLGLTVLLIGAGAWLAFGRKSGPSVTTTASVDEIAQAVARELARRERGDTAPVPRERRTRSIPAYEAYLRASDPTLIRSDSGARVGLEYYRKAVALDSNYAAAWMGLGRMLFRAGGTNDGSLPPALLEESQTAVRRALALDDSLAEAHAMLGMMIARTNDFTGGEAHLNHAVALEPDRAKIRELLAMFYLGTGRYAEALVQAERAVALDPRSAAATAELARALLANDRYDEALDRLKPIMTLEPPLLRVPVIAAECYGRKKQWDQAISILAVPATQDPGSAAVYGYMHARAGNRAVADSVHQALKARWERGEIRALFLAVVPMARGDKDEAFSWLERALQDGSFRFKNGIALGAFDPLFNDLKPDPRLEDLRRRALHQKR